MAELLDRLKKALAGRYDVEREIGRGGSASVFVARDLKHARRVALKVLTPEIAAVVGPERFLREIETTASLTHPHILPLLDSGDACGLLYYVMPYVEGESLRHRLKREMQLPIDTAVQIAREVADALDYAHRHDLLHRDIKPENILLEEGHAVVTDFGIARAIDASAGKALTQTGIAVGTPDYMSPEQILGSGELDHRSDIYGLGCVLYEMLAGETPFRGRTTQAIMSKRLIEPVPRLSALRETVPEAIEYAVTKALSRLPADRHPTAAQFAEALILLPARVTDQAAPRAKHSSGKVMLVVLPFENMSRDPDQEYFSDGMTEEMIAQLVRINPEQLGVIARTSAMRYKHTDKGVDQIGRDLGVDYLVEGSVRRAQERVRITAQLIQIADQTHVWAESYDRDLADVFGIQADVARRIAEALAIELLRARAVEFDHPATNNPHAHEAYLKGRYHWNKRTADGIREGLAYFEQAVALDPAYAQGWAGIADSHNLLGAGDFSLMPPARAYPKAKAAAERALALDETLAEAHTAIGWALTEFDWEWEAAERAYTRAIECNPSYATAHQWYALHLTIRSRHEEAILEIEKARELDPLSLPINSDISWVLHRARRFEEAIAWSRRTLEMDRNFPVAHWTLGQSLRQSGQHDEANEAFQTAVQLSGGNPVFLGALGHGYAVAGLEDAARQVLDRLMKLAAEQYVLPHSIALIHLGLGDRGETFAWLERAYKDRSDFVIEANIDPILDPLRDDPRLGELVQRVGLGMTQR